MSLLSLELLCRRILLVVVLESWRGRVILLGKFGSSALAARV